ncbi:MAG: hypothetical protein WA667_11945 [Candidatus Nitrosopolaris sp.]
MVEITLQISSNYKSRVYIVLSQLCQSAITMKPQHVKASNYCDNNNHIPSKIAMVEQPYSVMPPSLQQYR